MNGSDAELLEAMVEDLQSGKANLQMYDAPFGRNLGLDYDAGVSEANDRLANGPGREFMSKYSNLIEKIDDGDLDVVDEMSAQDWPLFVEVCSLVDGLDVGEEELRAARGSGE